MTFKIIFLFLVRNKMSDEKQKYQCPCGSLVLKANQKQHEKTKKHINANCVAQSNFPVINQLRSAGGELQQHVKGGKKPRKQPEPEDFSDDDVEDEDDQFEDDDNDGWEEDVSALLEAMNSKLDNLLTALHVDVMKVMDRNEQMEARLAGMLVELKSSMAQSGTSSVASQLPNQQHVSVEAKKLYINEKCQ
jgi:hypothetical protein